MLARKKISCNFAAAFGTNDVEWCNGSTADFGSACQGSNPCSTLQILVLPVKVRILARQLKVEEKTCYFE